jgi:hypothetical protein
MTDGGYHQVCLRTDGGCGGGLWLAGMHGRCRNTATAEQVVLVQYAAGHARAGLNKTMIMSY